jgi:hypothetical protein
MQRSYKYYLLPKTQDFIKAAKKKCGHCWFKQNDMCISFRIVKLRKNLPDSHLRWPCRHHIRHSTPLPVAYFLLRSLQSLPRNRERQNMACLYRPTVLRKDEANIFSRFSKPDKFPSALHVAIIPQFIMVKLVGDFNWV